MSSPETVEFAPASSIPDSLSCKVLVDGSSVDEFTNDSSFDGDDGLVLQDEFGDLNGKPVMTFTGYACEPDDDGDVEEHLCFLDVEYVITICNEGAGTEVIESVILNIILSVMMDPFLCWRTLGRHQLVPHFQDLRMLRAIALKYLTHP